MLKMYIFRNQHNDWALLKDLLWGLGSTLWAKDHLFQQSKRKIYHRELKVNKVCHNSPVTTVTKNLAPNHIEIKGQPDHTRWVMHRVSDTRTLMANTKNPTKSPGTPVNYFTNTQTQKKKTKKPTTHHHTHTPKQPNTKNPHNSFPYNYWLEKKRQKKWLTVPHAWLRLSNREGALQHPCAL